MIDLLQISLAQRRRLHILFLAKYAEDWTEPPPVVHPRYGRELYTKFEVLSVLRDLAHRVEPCASLEAFEARMRRGPVPNYIFQIYNRELVRNPEILVSSLCARTGIPFLGSPPNVRAMAEDKWITKLMARAAGLPVPEGAVAVAEADLDRPPAFDGPYFIKPRFGANSESVDEGSICDSWSEGRERAAALLAAGEEVLIEALAPGLDVTVPVLGGPLALHPVANHSELRGGVQTERQKRFLAPGKRGEPFDDTMLCEELREVALAFSKLVQPCDYMRIDFRVAPDRSFRMLEFNVTCNLATVMSMNVGAGAAGVSHAAMIEHCLCYSLQRQRVLAA
ncbi:MAG: hypothetical protein OXE76_13770 [Alphaproteobacteria bacterium]|nr:hypothetical protein [Alphaproteobacteria bacterium]